MTPADRALQAYVAAWRELTPDSIGRLLDLCAEDVLFRDPFNNTTGTPDLRRILEHMFAETLDPRFTVRAGARVGDTGFLAWTFRFVARKSGKTFKIEGVAEISFRADGKVSAHVDHWDVAGQLYASVPVLGFLLRKIRCALSPTAG